MDFFQTTMVNLEGLSKFIDSTQLTSDLDGSLHYDHAQWIDIRLVSIISFKLLFCVIIYLFIMFFLSLFRVLKNLCGKLLIC